MDQALVDLRCPPQKVRIHHLGVDVKRIRFIPRQIQEGKPVCILMFSSFGEEKEIHFGIEMSAAGIPVIANHHCDIPNVIIDGETGLLAPERDVQALTEVILTLASSPDSWILMGKAGCKRIEKEFDCIKQVLRLEKIYKEFI